MSSSHAAPTSPERKAKDVLVGDLKAKFDRMTSAVLVDFKGLNVDTVTRLRNEFRKGGVEYKVVKNTLLKQAIKDKGYAGSFGKHLVGMTGIAWSYEDPSAAAKIVKNFKRDGGDAGAKIGVKAGILENEVLDGARVENELANLPGKDELRAKLLATFQAPLQQFVALLQAPAQNFVYVLAAKEEKG